MNKQSKLKLSSKKVIVSTLHWDKYQPARDDTWYQHHRYFPVSTLSMLRQSVMNILSFIRIHA